MVTLLGILACVTQAPPLPLEAPAAVEAEVSGSASAFVAEDVVRRWSQIPQQPEQRTVEGRLVRYALPTELGGAVTLVLRLDGGTLVALPAELDDPAWSALEGRTVRVEGLLRPGSGDGYLGAPLLTRPGQPEAADGQAPSPPTLHLSEAPLDAAVALAAEVYQLPVLVFGEARVPAMQLPGELDPAALLERLADAAGAQTGEHGGLRWLAPTETAGSLSALAQAEGEDAVARLAPQRVPASQVAATLAAQLGAPLRQAPTGWLMAGGALPARAGLQVLASAAGGALTVDESGWRLGGGVLPPMQARGGCEEASGPCCAKVEELRVLGLAPGPRARAVVTSPDGLTQVVGFGDALGCPVVRPADALLEQWIVYEIRADALVLQFPSTGRQRVIALQ
ncbi:MAG: hypothetical protein H6741_15135 [Alphaproteobacteria bacterium]|nr:hypothetical protein [Alphaproteobacteria bacterium]